MPITATATRDAAVRSPALDRNVLLAAILVQLVALLDEFQRSGFSPLRDQWRALNAHQGRMVDVSTGDGSFAAKVLDVGEDGSLVVEREGKRTVLTAAEISVRLR